MKMGAAGLGGEMQDSRPRLARGKQGRLPYTFIYSDCQKFFPILDSHKSPLTPL